MKVDGKDAEYEDFSDTFVSNHLDEGEHEIELYYETPGLKAGAAISAGCVGVFLLLLLFRQIVKRCRRLKFKENSDRYRMHRQTTLTVHLCETQNVQIVIV